MTREFDPMNLVVLWRAFSGFDVRDTLDRVGARLFYVLCDTDEFYPAATGSEIVRALREAGIDVTYHEVGSLMGHYSTAADLEKSVPEARAFIDRLASAG